MQITTKKCENRKTGMRKKTSRLQKMGMTVLVLAMVCSLAACGGNSTPAEIMKTAQDKLAAIKSMSYEMTMDMEMSAAGQTINMAMTGDADYVVDPAAMSMDMTMDMGDQGAISTKMYLEEKDGAFVVYTGVDYGTGSLTWSSQTVTDIASLEQYNAQASMDMYLSCADSFKENGIETINGAETTRYDGVISKDAMNQVMTNSGILGQFAGLGLDEAAMESMLKDLGDLPISIWIEKDSCLPVRYEMDMTAIMQNLMTKMMESVGSSEEITIGKVIMSMTISNLNGVDSITIPDEALSAVQ